MNNPTKLLIALGVSALPSMIIAAFALEFSEESHNSTRPAHHHMSEGRSGPAAGSETTFYTEMASVNARMHEGMEVAPTGDSDRDFARMMIPHHQGAIDMALVLLKYGRDEKLRRLAQSIIVEQGQEIAYMRSLQNPPSAQPSATLH